MSDASDDLGPFIACPSGVVVRMLAVNLETSTQDLGEQAINMLFEAHRLNRIA